MMEVTDGETFLKVSGVETVASQDCVSISGFGVQVSVSVIAFSGHLDI